MMDETSGQNAEPSFEKELANLENAVNLLERGDLGLEAAIREYERGFQSIKRCQEILERAQKKVEVLAGRDGTTSSWSAFTAPIDAAPAQHAPADGPPE